MRRALQAVGIIHHELDDIVSVFTTTAARLDAYVNRKLESVATLNGEIADKTKQANADHALAQKAQGVATKVRDLVG